MRFTVPYYNIDKVKKMAEKLAKKTNNVKFEIINEVWLRFPNLPKEDPRRFKAYEIEVEGSYRIEDWEFVASLEHLPTGNMIRNISDRELPKKFRTCKPYCEHCNTLRNRKDTFVLFNHKVNEYKQVGRQCLENYTGMSLEEVSSIAEAVRGFEMLEVDLEDDSLLEDYKSRGYCIAMYNFLFKQYAYKVISTKGYDRDTTVGEILEAYEKGDIDDNDYLEELEEITKWIEADTSDSEYMSNLKVLWNAEALEPKHYRTIASGIFVALRDIKRAKSVNNEHIGTVGQRIPVEIESVRVLYTRHDSFYGDSYLYKIVDTQGHTLIYSTDRDLSKVKKMVATVKAHEEYKGEKQTVITRAKIEAYKEEVVKSWEQKAEHHALMEEELNQLMDELFD